jgi:hypothetical protein
MLLVACALSFLPFASFADALIPEGTTVYLETTKTVIGKKKETSEGDIVPARVWRDVVVDGQVVIKGGTPATTKVSSVKNRGIFGIKGKMSIAAVETQTIDGQKVSLTGGYNKEGQGRVGLTVGIGMLLFWPALFIPGDAAKLPSGTVMDSFTMGALTVATEERAKPAQPLNFGALMSGFDVEVLYDKLANEKKPKNFEFMITTDLDAPDEFVIDRINGSPIDPIPLKVISSESDGEDEEKSVHASVKIKTLVKQFQKGFNTFEVSYDDGDSRVAEEVLLQIEL